MMGLEWDEKNRFDILGFEVIKAHPLIEWPKEWAWKDDCISDDCVHPIAGNRFTGQYTGWYRK